MNIIKANHSSEIPKNFTGIVEWPNRTKYWYKEGNLHREDGPAIDYLDKEKHWYKEGKRHREDGPAVELICGTKRWYLEDKNQEMVSLRKYIILDYYKGKYNLMWYKLLDKNKILDIPNIPGLIMDFITVNTSPYYFALHSKYKTKINTDQGSFINDKKNHNIRKNKCMV